MNPTIEKAADILRSGGLVAFPTETVYGLGADATNDQAIAKIFQAKGRPPTNPLIVHVADIATAKKFAAEWPLTAHRLALKFWPGPLTLVLPKSPLIVDTVTAGKNTVGLRSPNHPLALALLKEFKGPLAAPSANRSTRVSPTTAQHVRDELGDSVDLILDGGPCSVGIESTVLDLTTLPPTILRPGAITREQIEAIVGPVHLFTGHTDPITPASSPGQQPVHYAPIAIAIRFDDSHNHSIIRWCSNHADEPWSILLLRGLVRDWDLVKRPSPWTNKIIHMPENPTDYAKVLYATLRSLDDRGIQTIFIQMPPDTPEWLAIRDRLLRATRPFPPNPS
ncbi:MAG TPA: L-threonylcarbamoyladenylate synthase [Tepidisphaeraceae bacterium]|jgi:L-threonylcarbamoyladenylate synthase|nr:L-threonylcarbamoyladenylate synthase [Tepidisphaeraceae bacterium]